MPKNEIRIYRRRSITLILTLLFAAVTVVMIAGLLESFSPAHTGLYDLKITGTGRTISIICTLLMICVTYRYADAYLRRKRHPVIRITPDHVHFDLASPEPVDIYFHDVSGFSPIEGNFETAVVHYRVDVPKDDPAYPASIEVPIGLTMNRGHVLSILNERAARGASLPAPPVHFPAPPSARHVAEERRRREDAARDLPPADKTVLVHWERWAPLVPLVASVVIVVLMWLIMRTPRIANDYLWFVKLSTWSSWIMAIFIIIALALTVYMVIAIVSPKLRLLPDRLIYRGTEVPYSSLRSVVVEKYRKRMSQNRYVTQHFIRFNYTDPDRPGPLPGLDPDLLEMSPYRIAAIIDSRIIHLRGSSIPPEVKKKP